MGISLQKPALEKLTVLKPSNCFSGFYRQPAPREVLKQMQLEEKATPGSASFRRPAQRLAVPPRCGQSKVLFLDEPTTGLDPQSRRQLWTSFAVSSSPRHSAPHTHYMDEAERCDRWPSLITGVMLRHPCDLIVAGRHHMVEFQVTATATAPMFGAGETRADDATNCGRCCALP